MALGCAAVALLSLFVAARWVCVCVLDALLVPDRRAEDFELENCGCVRPGSVEHEMQLEGRGV